MPENKRLKRFTAHQLGAFVTVMLVAIWSAVVLWLHLFEPIEINSLELTILIALLVISVVLVPIIWLRWSWGYLVAILLFIGLFVGAVLAVSERSYFFSASWYNFSAVGIYLVAVAGIYLNLRAYREQPRPRRRNLLLGLGGAVVFIVLIVFAVQNNTDAIYEGKAIRVQDRLAGQLDQMGSVDEKLQFLVEKGNLPSLVAGIVVNDELVWVGAYGDAEISTAYLTGSVTKMFTATAVMQLYEQQLVDLDADVNNYLPFVVRHPAYAQEPITVRMLLTHQSGLNHLTIPQEAYFLDETLIDWLAQEHGWPIQAVTPHPDLADYLEGMLTPGSPYYFDEVWSQNRPGQEHLYANTNYFLLALLIETVTGQRFTDYMAEHIFEPLQMNHTGYDPVVLAEQMAVGYERQFTLLSKTNQVVPTYQNVPGPGGLISTVPDLSRFMIAQLNQGQVNNVQLLSPASISMMHEQATQGSGHINKVGYGLGFTHLSSNPWEFYDHYYGLNGAVGHEGGNIGYAGALYFVEEANGGYGFILLTNESTIEKGVDFSWYFSVYYKINTLLMEEAAARHGDVSLLTTATAVSDATFE